MLSIKYDMVVFPLVPVTAAADLKQPGKIEK